MTTIINYKWLSIRKFDDVTYIVEAGPKHNLYKATIRFDEKCGWSVDFSIYGCWNLENLKDLIDFMEGLNGDSND